MSVSTEDLVSIQDAARLSGMMPYLEEAVDKMKRTAEQRVFAQLNAGELTPELAMQAWIERQAFDKLLKVFAVRVKIGQSVGARNASALTEGM